MKTISLLILAFVIFNFSMALASDGNLYEDPRERYTILFPEGWTTLEDGRYDIFKGEKDEEDTAYLTILAFPPLEEGETVDDFLNLTLELLEPDEVLEKEEMEFLGKKGAVLEFIKETKTEEEEAEVVRKKIYITFDKEEILTLTIEAFEEVYPLFEDDFAILIDSFNLSKSFGGSLFMEPDGFYSIELPYNWGIGPNPDPEAEVYFVGIYDKGFSFCDVSKMAKPMATSDIEVILDYWVEEIEEGDHKITEAKKVDFKIAGEETALLRHEYIEDTGRTHIVEDYIFMKDSYLFIVSFDTKEDFYKDFENDFEFILSSIKIEV